MKIVFLGDAETAAFFGTQGVETIVVESEEEITKAIKSIKKSKEYGLLIVTYDVVNRAREEIDSIRFSKTTPLIVDIPSINKKEKIEIDLAGYITQAIGIKI